MSRLFIAWKTTFYSLIDDRSMPRSVQMTALALILLGCLTVRLIVIDVPPLDRTMWKEIDYIEISKNYQKNGFDFFKPEITWPAEPPRVTAMEFPLVPYLAAALYSIFGFNVYTVRLISCVSFLVLTVFVFLLSRRELGAPVGLLSAMVSAVIPIDHGFGNILFSEPTVFACSAGAVYYFACAIESNRKLHWTLATMLFSLAVALKLEPLFLLLPISWASFRLYGFELKRYGKIALSICIAMVLPILWFSYAYHLGKTSIDVFGVFGGHDKLQTFTMLADPSWYRTMLLRLRWDILGEKVGAALFGIGLISCVVARRGGLIISYLLAVVCYFAIVAEGNIDAPYRQLNAVTPASILMAVGALAIAACGLSFTQLVGKRPKLQKWNLPTVALIAGLSLLSLYFINNHSKTLIKPIQPKNDRETFSEQVKKYAKPGDKLIMLGEYTTHKGGNDLSPVIYYYTGLQGWTLQKREWDLRKVHELIGRGAAFLGTYRMSREPDSAFFMNQIREYYPLLFEDRERELSLYQLR